MRDNLKALQAFLFYSSLTGKQSTEYRLLLIGI